MFFGIIDKGVDLAFQNGNARGDAQIVAAMKLLPCGTWRAT
jgi:hypothetical protein